MTDFTFACSVNGEPWSGTIDDRTLLLDFVRDDVGLKGARSGCSTGDCGACSVVVDGKVVKGCLRLASSVEGRKVATIEGAEGLDALRQAFVSEHGFQCGFCTSGMVLSAAGLLARNPSPNDAEIRWALCGNLCRCTGYDAIVAAVRRASVTIRGEAKPTERQDQSS